MRIDKMANNSKLEKLNSMLAECTHYYSQSIPLCAAENPISPFSKIPLSGDFQERYIMGSSYEYRLEDNFIGSNTLLPFYSMIHEECQVLFGAHYADARTLSGMNCLTTLLMSLTSLNEKIAILPPTWGGHSSIQPVCERLGLQVYELPYDYSKWDINYDKANNLIKREKINYILLAPSDIIHPPSVECFDLSNCTLLYDISQLMGLIAAGLIPSPIKLKNAVIFGGTHKTLPGPASGLILTNDEEIHLRIEQKINPIFLRHTQMHQVISLLFALIEFEYYGKEYTEAIIKTSNQLGNTLAQKGFQMGEISNHFSETHQLFIFCNYEEMLRINQNAIRFGVTLNKKEKSLFKGSGIRLGTQEIARYGWNEEDLSIICEIMALLRDRNPNKEKIATMKEGLSPKEIHYTFSNSTLSKLTSALHHKQIEI